MRDSNELEKMIFKKKKNMRESNELEKMTTKKF